MLLEVAIFLFIYLNLHQSCNCSIMQPHRLDKHTPTPVKRKAFGSDESKSMPTNRIKACTCCRQVKVRYSSACLLSNAERAPLLQTRCDSAETFPAPCTRCHQKGLDCRFEANFKRTPTRKLVNPFREPQIFSSASLLWGLTVWRC